MGALDHLLLLLRGQRDVLTRLQHLCQEERTCLLNSQLARLEAISMEQRQLLTSQTQLSARITRVLERLGADSALSGPVTLRRVAETLQDTEGAQVRDYYQEISALATDLQREGRVNWYLAQQALKYVDFTLKLVGRVKEGPMLYTPHAQTSQARSLQLLMDNCA